VNLSRLAVLAISVVFALCAAQPARAAERLPVVATFSILADMVQTIGGDRVAVTTLVGPDGDAHVFQPTPRHARAVAGAALVFANGLGFEGWIERLIEASDFKGKAVMVSRGVVPVTVASEDAPDPHAWQSLSNAKTYAANITGALAQADPAGEAAYQANLGRYLAQITVLEQEAAATLGRIPDAHRRVVTPHDAFGYLAREQRITFLAPQGFSTEAEASAASVATLIQQIRAENIRAVFFENVADPRLVQQIQRETGARIGGTLYSDALSAPDGDAGTYLDMMRHNIRMLTAALGG
jgi:zinc/manganese transport system substrate-binding protein